MDFTGCDRQSDWLEISLLHDKSDKHLTIYSSYNAECTARMIKKIELSNISDVYSATNLMKFDISNDTQKHLLWKQYVAWHCNGVIPLRQFPTTSTINQEPLLESTILALNPMKKSILIYGTDSDTQTRLKNRAEMTLN